MGISGLWVLMKSFKKKYPENMKKIMGAVWKLPAKYIAQPIQPIFTQIGLDCLDSRQLLNGSQDFFDFNILIFINFLKYETIETHAHTFLPLNISAVGSVF